MLIYNNIYFLSTCLYIHVIKYKSVKDIIGCLNMDLFGGYLLVIILLFSANIALLLGNIKLNNFKLLLIALGITISFLVISNLSSYLKGALNFLLPFYNYLFILVCLLLFIIMIYYVRGGNWRVALLSVGIVDIVLVVLLSFQSNFYFIDSLLYSLCIFITVFFAYQLSKLLIYAKRDYPIIVGEYMVLMAILIFIFGLTYQSIWNLDYSMFSPFLILTPTYQLIYGIIFMVVILIIGLFYNDNVGGKL